MNIAPEKSVLRRDSPRPDLIAFEVKAKITKADIEWMSAITDAAIQSHDMIDMLIVMSNFEGSDLDAIFDTYSASVQARSVAHINRYVVVGAPRFAEVMIKFSGLILPVQSKTFDLQDEQAAWDYLAQKPSASD